ncbi:S8 family serine peptidase [Streptantibioticus ferralitis]|uniref:S8 family serine peptidase n=1 Tax=Streptantibioticus ferralitis TaxID=236510 RepID=A0ABT5YVL3_9ACTN|nr:S8 family serine peptidase [Streptantibioticus ferralitis]MDF2255641.1 S8 family serine peptidase [Streptantibioticus ferralitis]
MFGWRKPQLAGVTLTAASMVLAFGTAANGTPLTLTSAPNAQAVSDNRAPTPVIVILKDQIPSVPADAGHLKSRARQTASAQAPLLAKVKASGGTRIKSFVVGNAFSATVSPALRAALAADPAVASVVPDETVTVNPPHAAPPVAPGGTKGPRASTPKAQGSAHNGQQDPNAICPSDPSKPLLEPEALYSTHVESTPGSPGAQDIADGRGVKVAYIADGLDPDNPDFIRPDGSHAVIDHQDFSGDGWDAPSGAAEAFGDASAMVAQGTQSYDLSKFVNPTHPLPAGCNIRIKGIAPGASLVALKAGGSTFPNSAILQSIDYAVSEAHVDVLNESFGSNVTPDSSAHDTISLFNDQAVAAGVTVTVSSGDAGINSTIGTPSTDPHVISTGASTDNQSYLQTGYAAAQFSNGTWADNNISALSSGGFTQAGRTVDLVAPGEADWALCSPKISEYTECTNFNGTGSPIQPFGGTSQSAPLTAGAAALVIQAYRDGHQGKSPTPELVKQLLTGTAQDLGLPAQEQGAGLLNVRGAVEAARGYQNSSGARQSDTLAVTTGQVDITGHPGSDHTANVTVVNTGHTTQTVNGATRTFAPLADARQTVALNSSTDQQFAYATNGAPWVHHDVKFTVPPGADRLAASIAWKGAAQRSGANTVTPVVRLTLLDPSGRLETNTRPQGGPVSANFGIADVPHPVAGEWTAILYTPVGSNGFTGPVQLDTATQRAVQAGSVSPQVTQLAPGQSKTLHVHLTTPATSGDSAESITVAGSNGHTTSVPVILRSLVDLSGGRGAFSGAVTGGNGRDASPAQSFTYAFDVPRGHRDVRVGVTLSDPNGLVQGTLISPNGTPIDIESNALINPAGDLTGTTRGVSATTLNPAAGRWRFVLVVINPVSGAELNAPFHGTIGLDQDRATATGLPNNAAAKLAAGKPTTVNVTYTNNTAATQMLHADGRLATMVDLPLVPQVTSGTVALPLHPTSTVPGFLVPPGTDKLTAVAASSVPAQLELGATSGSPDAFGDLKQAQDGSTVSVVKDEGSTSQPVVPGFWSSYVQQIGPFPAAGAPAGTSTITASAHTQAFDPAITSSTNDPFAAAANASAPALKPVAVKPGATGTLQVTITPRGPKGSTVHGVLYLVSAPGGVVTANNQIGTTGSVLAAIPYSYTVN